VRNKNQFLAVKLTGIAQPRRKVFKLSSLLVVTMTTTIPKDKWPEWIKERMKGRKNVEVKERNENFYLYEYQHAWDKKLKRAMKTTKYVGVIKRYGGRIYEHGHVAFLLGLLNRHGVVEKLKKHFPDEWPELLTFSLNRVIYPSPLKRIGSWSEKTTLWKFLGTGGFSGKRLSRALAEVGTNIEGQTEFMRELITNGEMLIYDKSVIFSDSNHNKLLEIGYDPDELFLPKANITLLFSKERNVPVHFRVLFGSVHEIRAITAIMEEIRQKDVIFIGDKACYKNELYDDLNEEGIRFILPLPRDDERIRYRRKLPGVFEYRDRIVKCTAYRVKPYHVYLYEDQRLKYEQTSEYYRMSLAGREVTFHEEWAGKIALVSNVEFAPKEAYLMWKTRDRIEKAFDVLQNLLRTDHPYVSREDVFRGYLFGSFISLFVYYLVLNLLQKRKVNDRVSVEDVLFEFSKVMLEDRKPPLLAEIPKKVQELATKLKVHNIVTKFWES